ncbi:uncharacterized protein LOC107264569 [Cephus cinctus]|uniref:Uncharacterized protein LOC107264569 n=1 Tax=Cephus cinctus TaxID=211228 RepID=A0AAJ7BKR5_CEPCN|nr:uncharacterized protein LOC107264569 [Cephus cinctus]
MAKVYFQKLTHQAQELDAGLKTLSEIWKLHRILIRDCEADSAEAERCIRKLWTDVKSIKADIQHDVDQVTKNSLDMDQFLNETRESFQNAKQECDEIESVFQEYGYAHSTSNSVDMTNNSSSLDSSIMAEDEMEDIDIKFTPDMKWHHRSGTYDTPISVEHSSAKPPVYGIAIPVIKSLASVKENETPNVQSVEIQHTPFHSRFQEPIYSPHFYNLGKK